MRAECESQTLNTLVFSISDQALVLQVEIDDLLAIWFCLEALEGKFY